MTTATHSLQPTGPMSAPLHDILQRLDRPALLLTGVTGGLGGELLPRLLAAEPDRPVILPIRAETEARLAHRVANLVDWCGLTAAERARLIPVRSDVCSPGLGFGALADAVAERVGDIFHLAANVGFDVPLEQSRRDNVDSTRNVLDFARVAAGAGTLRRLNYVSTAFVCGRRSGRLLESELNCGQGFLNGYEQAKMEAEELVAAAMGELPVTVYRPSQIVGNSVDGRLRKFFGFYDFLRLALENRLRVVLADPDARMDFVSVDYVAGGMLHLSRLEAAVGQTYHFVGGLDRSLSVRQIVDVLARYAAENGIDHVPKPPRIFRADMVSRMVSAVDMNAMRKGPAQYVLRTYLPYLNREYDFDVGRTAQLLEAAGIPWRPMDEVLPIIGLYAVRSKFHDGERQMPADAVMSAALTLP